MIVVDRAVWTGDAATAPRPLSVDDVRAALHRVDPSATFHLLGDGDMRMEGGVTNAQSLSPGDVTPADKQVTGAYVLPSADAVHRALPGVRDGVAGSVLPTAFAWASNGRDGMGHDFSVTARWLVIDNVVLCVALTDATPTAADRAFIATLVHALDPSR